jgi:hypothetical protein
VLHDVWEGDEATRGGFDAANVLDSGGTLLKVEEELEAAVIVLEQFQVSSAGQVKLKWL